MSEKKPIRIHRKAGKRRMKMELKMDMSAARKTGLYVLKHKDLDVAMVQVDLSTGGIDYVLEVYMPGELPIGCDETGAGIVEWWKSRAIPDTRRGIQQILRQLNEETNLSLMLSAYGLSLTDHFWLQPVDKELYWKNLNFYENDFSDELGSLLTDSGKIDYDAHVSKFSPSSSVNGEMKKKWVIRDGIRYLLKVNRNDYGQQSVNEKIASCLHRRLGWKNYIPYIVEKMVIEGQEYPCALVPLFTSPEVEFVSGYQLIGRYKTPNDLSNYEAMIILASEKGMDAQEIRRQLEYTIMTDFILSNTDRHFNNLGFLYHGESRRFVKMAPIFDTGNSLFYDQEIIPSGKSLLDIRVASFCKREVDMLRYVQERKMIDIKLLSGFAKEAEHLLQEYTKMPDERRKRIAQTIEQKIEYIRLFQQGKQIWKRAPYW